MKWLPPVVFFILLIAILEFVTKSGWVANYLLASPSEMALSLKENFADYQKAFFSTMTSTLKGLALSFIVGSLVAAIFSLSELTKKAILPFCVFFQTVPIIAIAPLMVIWFGFGEPTVIASSAIVAFFPILANTLMGLDSTKPSHRDLFKLYSATRLQSLIYLQIPSSIPAVLTGLRIAAGLSVIGAIVGEFVGGGGLGGLIDSARTQQKTEMVFAAVLLSSFLGLILISIIHLLKSFLRRYYL